ncbi:tetratricopeptide repeat protein [Candidatus Latescibacterota bacterium]
MAKKKKKKDKLQPNRIAQPGIFKGVYPALIIIILGIIIYSNSFDCSFHFDDYSKIVNNRHIKSLDNLSSLWKYKNTRFIGFLSLALNHHVHGLDVFGYHFVNVAIHILSSILVWWLALLTLTTPVMKRDGVHQSGNLMAIACGLIFLAHPIQTQSVTYIVQRFASLAAFFYIASICCYAAGRLASKKQHALLFFVGAVITGLLGMLTKEIVFTLPVAIILYELAFLHTGKIRELLTGRKAAILGFAVLGTVVLVITLFSFRFAEFFRSTPSQRTGDPLLTGSVYLMTQFKVIPQYIRLLIMPFGLNIDHDIPATESMFEPAAFFGFLMVAGVLALGVWFFKKSRLLSFGVMFFFLGLSVESSLKPLHNVMFEHRLYLPMVGYSMFMAGLLLYLLRRIGDKSVIVVLCGLICLYSALTYQRNVVWRDDLSLWSDAAEKSPNRARPYYNIGLAHKKSGKNDEAIYYFNKALRINPNHTNARNNIGEIYFSLRRFDEAIVEYRKAVDADPKFYIAPNNIGNAYLAQGNFDKAVEAYKESIAIFPYFTKSFNGLGRAYYFLGRFDDAVKQFREALMYDENYSTAVINMGETLLHQGKTDEALVYLRKAVRLAPRNRRARELLGKAEQTTR